VSQDPKRIVGFGTAEEALELPSRSLTYAMIYGLEETLKSFESVSATTISKRSVMLRWGSSIGFLGKPGRSRGVAEKGRYAPIISFSFAISMSISFLAWSNCASFMTGIRDGQ